MARLARIVVSRLPHHVTQRGNRRQIVFFGDDDYRAYLALLEGARAQRRRRHLGVVPHAEPCPPDARAADAGCPAPDAVGGALPLFADGEFPPGLARLSVAGPLYILSPGRGACAS